MDATIVAAIVAAVATIVSAIIGAVVTLRKKNRSPLFKRLPIRHNEPTRIRQRGENDVKQIAAQSITGGTIVQVDKIETLHVQEWRTDSKVDLRLVDITIKEPIEHYPLLDVPSEERREGLMLFNFSVLAFENIKHGFPVLDIKLRNAGTETVVLKRAEFKILKVGRFKNPRESLYQLLNVSWNYDVLFSPDMEGQSVTVSISHSLRPNEADRFTFTIGQRGASVETPVWYYFQLYLFYNEDDRFIVSEPILVSVPSQTFAPGQTQIKFHEEYIEYNRKIVGEFAELPGLKGSAVQKVIERWKADKR